MKQSRNASDDDQIYTIRMKHPKGIWGIKNLIRKLAYSTYPMIPNTSFPKQPRTVRAHRVSAYKDKNTEHLSKKRVIKPYQINRFLRLSSPSLLVDTFLLKLSYHLPKEATPRFQMKNGRKTVYKSSFITENTDQKIKGVEKEANKNHANAETKYKNSNISLQSPCSEENI